MSEERLIELETRVAFQEDMIQELNRALYRQQKQIDQLEALCRSLVDHIRDLAAAGAGGPGNLPHEKPPHY